MTDRLIYWLPEYFERMLPFPDEAADFWDFEEPPEEEGIIMAKYLRVGDKFEPYIRSLKREEREGIVLTVQEYNTTKQPGNKAIITDDPRFKSLGGGTLVYRFPDESE